VGHAPYPKDPSQTEHAMPNKASYTLEQTERGILELNNNERRTSFYERQTRRPCRRGCCTPEGNRSPMAADDKT
jgi:hypothetical protein